MQGAEFAVHTWAWLNRFGMGAQGGRFLGCLSVAGVKRTTKHAVHRLQYGRTVGSLRSCVVIRCGRGHGHLAPQHSQHSAARSTVPSAPPPPSRTDIEGHLRPYTCKQDSTGHLVPKVHPNDTLHSSPGCPLWLPEPEGGFRVLC